MCSAQFCTDPTDSTDPSVNSVIDDRLHYLTELRTHVLFISMVSGRRDYQRSTPVPLPSIVTVSTHLLSCSCIRTYLSECSVFHSLLKSFGEQRAPPALRSSVRAKLQTGESPAYLEIKLSLPCVLSEWTNFPMIKNIYGISCFSFYFNYKTHYTGNPVVRFVS